MESVYEKIEYGRIRTIMKRYSFVSKMDACFNMSQALVGNPRPSLDQLWKAVLPHEVEGFFMFSIMDEEYGDKNILSHDASMVKRIIKSIDEESVKIIESGNNEFGANMMQSYCPSQVDIQSDIRLLLMRYRYFFTFKNEKIDMNEQFVKKFEIDYDTLVGILLVLNQLCVSDENVPEANKNALRQFLCYISGKKYIDNFTIEREKYVDEQRLTSGDNINNYPFCIKLVNQYPFVKYNDNLFIPLPHVVKMAFTKSLLIRLMDNNGALKSSFGKEVFENYLFDLFNESQRYQLVRREFDISKGRKSSDVMIFDGNMIVFIEGKTTFPRAGIRTFDRKNEDSAMNGFAKGIMEIFHAICDYCEKNNVKKEDCYGLLVFEAEDNIVPRQKYAYMRGKYEEIDDNDYKYIISHIKTISLYECEELCCTSNDKINDILRKWSQNEETSFNITIEGCFSKEKNMRGLFETQRIFINRAVNDFINKLRRNLNFNI